LIFYKKIKDPGVTTLKLKKVKMANMQTRLESFISDNNLDESISDSLIDLVNGCFTDYVEHMSKDWLNLPKPIKQPKITKGEKLDSCSDAESLDDLRGTKCTTTLLNEYCRTHSIRVGGTKKEIAERVWRHLQGEQSDSDLSPKGKSKKTPAKKELHACFACNAKGQPCGIAATEQFNGEWFCFRHQDDSGEIIAKKKNTREPEKVTKPREPKEPKEFEYEPEEVVKVVKKVSKRPVSKKTLELEEEE
jgi:hypothetical protein